MPIWVEAGDNEVREDLPLIERLQRDEQSRGVVGAAFGKSVHGIHAEVRGNDIDRRQHYLVHGLERDVQVGQSILESFVILLREKSLGHSNEQVRFQPDSG